MAPVGTRAVLLRAHAYGETSRILRFYTHTHGLLSVMAHGVRGRSGKGTMTLDTFASGELTAYVRPQRDLHTMKDFSCTHLRSGLGGDLVRFAGASAVAELVVSHTDQEPHPEVFVALEEALDALERVDRTLVPTACLAGAWRIVDAFGFAPELDACARCARPLGTDAVGRFDLGAGGILCGDCAQGNAGPRVGPVARGQIRSLLEGVLDEPVTYPRRHLALLSDFVAFHVAQKPLKTFRFLADFLPSEEDGP
ncbi:MAG TPA: DNA repair protein RecO [Longimicrobiales bacterium]|nr:DNA repair protein RecO [Longimicrobiales bacterium]